MYNQIPTVQHAYQQSDCNYCVLGSVHKIQGHLSQPLSILWFKTDDKMFKNLLNTQEMSFSLKSLSETVWL